MTDNAIYILGHTGFIGSSLAARLTDRGVPVAGGSSANCDLMSPEQVRTFFRDMKTGSHVVCCSTINKFVADTPESLMNNIAMIQNLTEALKDRDPAALLFLSSVDVYGTTPTLPVTEATLPAPASGYGLAKLAGEHLLRMADTLACPVTIFRLPGVFGPRDKGKSVVGALTRAVDSGTVTITGDGSTLRDYVWIDDLIDLIESVHAAPVRGLFNVASGTSVSILEIARLIMARRNPKAQIIHTPAKPNTAGDLTFDISALKAAFPNYKPRPLKDGITSYLKAWETQQ